MAAVAADAAADVRLRFGSWKLAVELGVELGVELVRVRFRVCWGWKSLYKVCHNILYMTITDARRRGTNIGHNISNIT